MHAFTRPLTSNRGAAPSVLHTDDGLTIQVQLLQHEGHPASPTEVVDIEQRCSYVPPARIRVLTAPAFGAATLSGWLDRRTSRDLFDLYAMAKHGLITAESFELFAGPGSFTRVPTGPGAHCPPCRSGERTSGTNSV